MKSAEQNRNRKTRKESMDCKPYQYREVYEPNTCVPYQYSQRTPNKRQGDYKQRFMAAGNANNRSCDMTGAAFNDPRINPDYYYRYRASNVCPNYQGTWKQMNNPLYYNEVMQKANNLNTLSNRNCPMNLMMDMRSPQCTEGNCNHNKILRNVIEFCQHGEKLTKSRQNNNCTNQFPTNQQATFSQPKFFQPQCPPSNNLPPSSYVQPTYTQQNLNQAMQNKKSQSYIPHQVAPSQQYQSYPVKNQTSQNNFQYQKMKPNKQQSQPNDGYQEGIRQSFSTNPYMPRYFQPQNNCGMYGMPCGYKQDKNAGKKHLKSKRSSSAVRSNKSTHSLANPIACASKHSVMSKKDQYNCDMQDLAKDIIDPCMHDDSKEKSSPVTWLKSIGNKFLGVENDHHGRDKSKSRSQLHCFEKDISSPSKRLSFGLKNSFSNMLDGKQSHSSKRMMNHCYDHRRGDDKKCNSR